MSPDLASSFFSVAFLPPLASLLHSLLKGKFKQFLRSLVRYKIRLAPFSYWVKSRWLTTLLLIITVISHGPSSPPWTRWLLWWYFPIIFKVTLTPPAIMICITNQLTGFLQVNHCVKSDQWINFTGIYLLNTEIYEQLPLNSNIVIIISFLISLKILKMDKTYMS